MFFVIRFISSKSVIPNSGYPPVGSKYLSVSLAIILRLGCLGEEILLPLFICLLVWGEYSLGGLFLEVAQSSTFYLCLFYIIGHVCSVMLDTCSIKQIDITDILGGSYLIYIFVFLTPLWIFVPFVKMLFFVDYYFLVCIFKYRTS